MPLANYYADLAEALGCDRPGDDFELFTTVECDESVATHLRAHGIAKHRPLVVICPGAKYGAAKCWFPDRFAALADALVRQENATVVVTCGPGEEPLAREIRSRVQEPVVVFDEPRLTLGELKSLIRRSDLLVCNDTGPRHFAKAFGVGVVTVFGPTDPVWTATGHTAERIVRIDVPCGPCQQRVCPLGHLECMQGVTVEMVLASCCSLLREASLRQST